MAIYSKYKNVNTVFGGTDGIVVPTGTTAERNSGVSVGTLRYNTDLGLIEQYNALGWQSVDAPPAITNVSGTVNENTNSTLTITGSNFKSGAIAYIEGAAVGGIPRALSTTFVSGSSVTAATNASAVNYVGGASFDLKIVNPSGLSGTLTTAGTVDRDPVWSTAAGTYTVFDSARGTALSFTAADPDGGTITYSVATGSLPAGASLNTSSGAISGFSAVGSDTSSTFTLRATSSVGSQAADRSFTILVKAPVVQSFTTATTSSFTVPTGVTTMRVLVLGGGGGGGSGTGGGGGAGGQLEVTSYPVTPGGSIPYRVGGGAAARGQDGGFGSNGEPSFWGPLTALGGGGGGSGHPPRGGSGQAGGCGGGGDAYPARSAVGGVGQQPSQNPGIGTLTNFGNGGTRAGQPNGGAGAEQGGGGGCGAGGSANNGGAGRASDITGSSITRGGGGGGRAGTNASGVGGSGGGGQSWGLPSPSGGTNLGGGGGGGWDYGAGVGYAGGPGVIIVRY
jgi:Putative Ig domain